MNSSGYFPAPPYRAHKTSASRKKKASTSSFKVLTAECAFSVVTDTEAVYGSGGRYSPAYQAMSS